MRIGVFGGTFDPVHLGHLAIARTAREQAGLDKLLFVIAANPPHKPEERITSAETRVAMTEAAIEAEQGFEVSRIELDRNGPSYTADTLRLLQATMPEARLFFIVGYDSALDMPQWHLPEEIVRLARVLVAPRPENARPLPALLQGCSDMLEMPEYHLSSSEIRSRARRGAPLEGAVPPAVAAIIREKRLYQPCQ